MWHKEVNGVVYPIYNEDYYKACVADYRERYAKAEKVKVTVYGRDMVTGEPVEYTYETTKEKVELELNL